MRRRSGLFVLMFVVLGIGVCQHPVYGPLGSPFELDAGQSARITGSDLQLQFVRVESDSRCPAGVQCITAGEAVVALRARTGNAHAELLRLHLLGGAPPDSEATAHVDGYRVSLMGLDP